MTTKTSPVTLPKKVGIHIQAAALEAAANGILITDAKGVIQWVNHAFSLMTGYGADEAVGKPANLLKSGKQEPKYYRQLWKTVTAGKVWHGELINRRKNGRHYIEEMTITPVYDPGGNLTHFIAIKQDISARRRQEKKIKGSLARIEALYAESEKIRSQRSAILNSAGEAMALINTQGKFVMINRQFERFFSVKKNQVVGRRFADMIPRFGRVFDNPETLKSDLDESLKNPDDPSCRVITQKWPQKRELSVYGKVVRGRANRRIGVLYVFRDVTAEREVDRLKSEFVSLVSHELRTPLTSIMGYVDMILEGEAGPVTEEQADFLAVVKRNTARLTLLVRDLLDVSKIEAGAVKLKNEDLDLAGLIREAAGSLKTQFESKKQKL